MTKCGSGHSHTSPGPCVGDAGGGSGSDLDVLLDAVKNWSGVFGILGWPKSDDKWMKLPPSPLGGISDCLSCVLCSGCSWSEILMFCPMR